MEAERWGLVTSCVDQEEGGQAAFTRALAIGRELLQSVAPLALRMAKTALREGGAGSGLEEGLEVEEAAYHALLGTWDRAEGLEAFRQKRAPVFKGE